MQQSRKIESIQLLKNSSDLPSIPDIIAEINDVVKSPHSSSNDIRDVVKKDISVSAMILKLANSIVYNRVGILIADLDKAIARIGINETVNIATTVSLMHGVAFPAKLNRIKRLWVHSYATGLIARGIGRAYDPKQHKLNHELLFSAGLFHEIGRIAIASSIDETYFDNTTSKMTGNELAAAELELYGITHRDAGGMLLHSWGMPEDLCEAVKYFGNSIDNSGVAATSHICWYSSKLANTKLSMCDDLYSASNAVPEIVSDFVKDLIPSMDG